MALPVTHGHLGAPVDRRRGRLLTPVPNGAAAQWIAAARDADVRYVLDRLGDLNAGVNPDADGRRLPPGLRGGIDLCRVGIAGYSVGGATAASAMFQDPRLSAGLSLDGPVDGPRHTTVQGLDR